MNQNIPNGMDLTAVPLYLSNSQNDHAEVPHPCNNNYINVRQLFFFLLAISVVLGTLTVASVVIYHRIFTRTILIQMSALNLLTFGRMANAFHNSYFGQNMYTYDVISDDIKSLAFVID